jgi:hypothetical protein
MSNTQNSRVKAAVVPPIRRTEVTRWRGGAATSRPVSSPWPPKWGQMNSACARSRAAWGCSTRVWRVLPKGRANILFLVAANLQTRRTKAVAKHDGLRKRTARARVEVHLARMLAFDFEPGVKEWRRACAAQGWYWTREQQADLFGELPGPSSRLSATWVRPSRPSGASMRAR